MSKKTIKNSEILNPPVTKLHQISDSSLCTEVSNSYLVETTYNSDVDDQIRQDIEYNFKKSTVNSTYVFPRTNLAKNSSQLILQETNRRDKGKGRQKSMSSKNLRKGIDKSLPTLSKTNSSNSDLLSLGKGQPKDAKLFKRIMPMRNEASRDSSSRRRSNVKSKAPPSKNAPSPCFTRHIRWRSDALSSSASRQKLNPYAPRAEISPPRTLSRQGSQRNTSLSKKRNESPYEMSIKSYGPIKPYHRTRDQNLTDRSLKQYPSFA